ncbi:hypothetical protein [Georgenia sp. Z1491]|uniref:hypothetical protein n=1 Tax=Georgenia sp. Z1491 TaxID=3416707 RepID=UPI003CF18105
MSSAEFLRSELRRVSGELRDAEGGLRNFPNQVPPVVSSAVSGPANDLADGCANASGDADRVELNVRDDAAVQQAKDDWIAWAESVLETITDFQTTEVGPQHWSADGATAYANARTPQSDAMTFIEQHARDIARELEIYGEAIDEFRNSGLLWVGEIVLLLASIVAILATPVTFGVSGVLGIVGLVGSLVMMGFTIAKLIELANQLKDTTPFDELLATISSTPSLRSGEWPYALKAQD